jgi:hypothetical protein
MFCHFRSCACHRSIHMKDELLSRCNFSRFRCRSSRVALLRFPKLSVRPHLLYLLKAYDQFMFPQPELCDLCNMVPAMLCRPNFMMLGRLLISWLFFFTCLVLIVFDGLHES